MEDVLKACNRLYDELEKEKKVSAEISLKQSQIGEKQAAKETELKELKKQLDERAARLKVYEDIEAAEKANKVEAQRLKNEATRIETENAALADARKKLQKEIAEKTAAVNQEKEQYENERAALKKTQADLAEKQKKVDKFLAQVK